ncbi:hypothetical protein Tco_1413604 [Tanacetum coccineum]
MSTSSSSTLLASMSSSWLEERGFDDFLVTYLGFLRAGLTTFVLVFRSSPFLILSCSPVQYDAITTVCLQVRLEELEEEKKEADQLNSSQADRIKQLEEAFKQSKAGAHQLRIKKERYAVEAGRGEMVRQRIINQYLPTFARR